MSAKCNIRYNQVLGTIFGIREVVYANDPKHTWNTIRCRENYSKS
jgi:hypothetical protein